MKEENEKIKQVMIEELVKSADEGKLELTIREGQALDVWEPRPCDMTGNIDTPVRWLQKRLATFNKLDANVVVNRQNLEITLKVDERNKTTFCQVITGVLRPDQAFLKFGINSGKYMSTFALADLLKMNRAFFADHATAMNLVSALKNFKSSVQKKMEAADNDRGSKSLVFDQVLTSNIPESFILVLPIFRGLPKVHLKVEVYINADNYECALISPEANELVEEARDKEIDLQLTQIKNLSSEIVIIEQ